MMNSYSMILGHSGTPMNIDADGYEVNEMGDLSFYIKTKFENVSDPTVKPVVLISSIYTIARGRWLSVQLIKPQK